MEALNVVVIEVNKTIGYKRMDFNPVYIIIKRT